MNQAAVGAVGLGTASTVGGYVGAQQRKVEADKKFADTLGYDHHKYEEIGDEIDNKEGELAVAKSKGTDGKEDAARLQFEVNKLKKEQERVKTGREKEFYEYTRKQSGKLIKKGTDLSGNSWDTLRDDNGNIKRFARYGTETTAKQFFKELGEGFLKGAAAGALAGSVVPGLGTAYGAGVGGAIGGLRQAVFKYSGTTNKKVGDTGHKEDFKDKYKAPAEDKKEEHKADDHGAGGGDDHAAH